jgi:hypothetical protein
MNLNRQLIDNLTRMLDERERYLDALDDLYERKDLPPAARKIVIRALEEDE